MSSRTGDNCGNCRYSETVSAERYGESHAMRCLRYPPINSVSPQVSMALGHPQTRAEHWCGEHKRT